MRIRASSTRWHRAREHFFSAGIARTGRDIHNAALTIAVYANGISGSGGVFQLRGGAATMCKGVPAYLGRLYHA